MQHLQFLLKDVEAARQRYINTVSSLSPEQGQFKPSPEEWSAAQITEHLVYAEMGGVCGMYIAIENARKGNFWQGENKNKGLSIEELIENTWQTKEKVPPIAGPRMGGPLSFWIAKFDTLPPLLEKLTIELEGLDIEKIIQPHPISGPMDVRQRFEFLRFHMDRHRIQVERLMAHPYFPAAEAYAAE